MTAATLERRDAEGFTWKPFIHIDKYDAKDEIETAFTLFPNRTRALEEAGLIKKGKRGGLARHPQIESLGRDVVARVDPDGIWPFADPHGLVLPNITKAMMDSLGADVTGTVDHAGNGLANAGINKFGGWIIADAGTHYNAANTAIGAGDTNTAFAASQTDLAAAVNSANRWVQLVDSIPTFATQVFTAVATFATGNGNFAWAEWAVAQNTASAAAALTAAMLNRKVAALGTKTSAAAWAFTITITIS